ncbi:MAG: DUF2586 family protein [Flavobacteriales bacterium]
MAQLTGVSVNRLEGGLRRRNPKTDEVVALVAAMPVAALTLAYDSAYKLLQLIDAERLGVTVAFDKEKNSLVHHHISEIFRLSPDATCYLIPIPVDTSITASVDKLLPLIRSQKDIKGLGFVGFTLTLPQLVSVVEKIQGSLVDLLFADSRYIDFVVLEGKGQLDSTRKVKPFSPATMADLRTKKAPQVSVVIAQDPLIAAKGAANINYAAVGSALGMLSIRKVNENIGSVNIRNKPAGKKGAPDYPLTDLASKLWLNSALSDGTPIGRLSKVDLKNLTDKGYIYVASYEGYGGLFFNDSPTCVQKASDYAYIENNRTWNKMARLVRAVLIPEVKGVVKKDAQTGFIKSTTISRWQALVNSALERMVIAEELSGFDVYIDPMQITDPDKPLKVKIQGVADGVVHAFEVDLGHTQKINED